MVRAAKGTAVFVQSQHSQSFVLIIKFIKPVFAIVLRDGGRKVEAAPGLAVDVDAGPAHDLGEVEVLDHLLEDATDGSVALPCNPD